MPFRDIFRAGEDRTTRDLPAQVEEMRLYLAAWLRRREEQLQGGDIDVASAPSDLGKDGDDIFGSLV